MRRTASAAGPTLAVVAREAGVSVPTASKVVNGRDDVAPETRRRVTEVLDRLGYVRRRRSGPTGPHGMVDLVVSALDGAGAAVVRGVERAAHAEGLEVVVSAGRHVGRDRLDRLAARGTAGVLFHGDVPSGAQAAWLARHRVPYVLVDPVREPPPGTPWVGAADRMGGHAAAAHLLGLGHERIAVVAGPAPGRAESAWLAGWREAIAAAGLRVRPDYVWGPGPDGGDADMGGARDMGGADMGGAHMGSADMGGSHTGEAHMGTPDTGGSHTDGNHMASADMGGSHTGGAHAGTAPGMEAADRGGAPGAGGASMKAASRMGGADTGRAAEPPGYGVRAADPGSAGAEADGARRRMRELLDLPEPPTAVCVGSDAWAAAVYGVLAERGLRVPDDVSVVGYGDLPEARWAVPGLTTVRRPLAGVAGAAVSLLARLARGEPMDGLPVELATELVVRSSTAPPPAAGPARTGIRRRPAGEPPKGRPQPSVPHPAGQPRPARRR
ncbi:LacI family DNA-binding transcriptional regulator [Streptomyces sp. SudanB25_2051]|uniref:LacI family DNA-binding transcriptional regulator n=1 Tax=Streptomyces sp. SudanB25_2051 TaxID=3035275 RepID=UPI003F56B83F